MVGVIFEGGDESDMHTNNGLNWKQNMASPTWLQVRIQMSKSVPFSSEIPHNQSLLISESTSLCGEVEDQEQ